MATAEQLQWFAPSPAAGPPWDWKTSDWAAVALSGGKDSVASVLALLESGFPRDRIVLVHQLVDGNPDTDGPQPFDLRWDWPCTTAFCRALAQHLGIPLYFQWREGGLTRELFRENTVPAPIRFQHEDRTGVLPTLRATPNSRRKFPAQSASLMVRWCSSSAKMDALARAIVNEPKWQGTVDAPCLGLIVSGERAEESPARARYAVWQPHKTSTRSRRVFQYRIVHDWSERTVWDILRRHAIRPHPAYHFFPRCSCMTCIFLQDAHWRLLATIDPERVAQFAAAEAELGWTIDRTRSLAERIADQPVPTLTAEQQQARKWALHPETLPPIHWPWPPNWYPPGAFQGSAGGSP